MISRVADSCFWLTRYLERVGADHFEDGEAVERYLVWDADNPFSLFGSLRAVRENARTIREVMSVEMWEAVNDAWLWLNGRSARRLFDRSRDAFYQRLCSQCMMFHGICYSTMLHDEPFTFMKLGRAVERAGQTARVLGVRHHALQALEETDDSPAEAVQWLGILRSCSAYEPFFKRAGNVLSGSAVAQFMIFDRTFPRSILHNLDRTRGLLLRLRVAAPERPSRSWETLERLRGSILQLDMEDVHRIGLFETLEWIVADVARLCDAIHDEYLDPSLDSLRDRVHRGDVASLAWAVPPA